jgi:hypothetical protein
MDHQNSGPRSAVVDDVSTRAQDLLLCFVTALRRHAPTDGRGSRAVPGWYRGALRALRAAGLIDSSGREVWIDRGREALAGASEPDPPSAALRRRAATLVSRTTEGTERDELLELLAELGILVEGQRGPIPLVLLPLPAFGRKVSLSGKKLERAIVTRGVEGEFELEGIDLHPDGLVVRISGPAPDEASDFPYLKAGWRVRDELGTEYRLIGSGDPVGTGPRTSEARYYAPPVPAAASRLFITLGQVEAEVTLDGAS